jgi:SAM-dependent methyltransferase
MPALSPDRQPATPLDWFATEAGQGVLEVEALAVARVLAGCPALPWAWLGVPGATPPDVPGGRGLLLRRHDGGFEGAVRCALPLPLASESLGAVLLQHALDDGFELDALLGECERVLAPGGTLWLATLNPWSPYRLRWARLGLRVRGPGRWQALLRRAGFALDSVNVQWIGPYWRSAHGDAGVGPLDWPRAGLALSVTKRTYAIVPPRPLRSLRWQGAGSVRAGQLRRQAIMAR